MRKLMTICFFMFSCCITYAQAVADPHLIDKDGLPARRSPRYESNTNSKSEELESVNRNFGTVDVENTNQNEEEFSSEEEKDDSHFKIDSIYFLDDKGKRIKNPYSIYQDSGSPDSVKTNVGNSTPGPDGRKVDSVDRDE